MQKLFFSLYGIRLGVIKKHRRCVIDQSSGKVSIDFFAFNRVELLSTVLQKLIDFYIYVVSDVGIFLS